MSIIERSTDLGIFEPGDVRTFAVAVRFLGFEDIEAVTVSDVDDRIDEAFEEIDDAESENVIVSSTASSLRLSASKAGDLVKERVAQEKEEIEILGEKGIEFVEKTREFGVRNIEDLGDNVGVAGKLFAFDTPFTKSVTSERVQDKLDDAVTDIDSAREKNEITRGEADDLRAVANEARDLLTFFTLESREQRMLEREAEEEEEDDIHGPAGAEVGISPEAREELIEAIRLFLLDTFDDINQLNFSLRRPGGKKFTNHKEAADFLFGRFLDLFNSR